MYFLSYPKSFRVLVSIPRNLINSIPRRGKSETTQLAKGKYTRSATNGKPTILVCCDGGSSTAATRKTQMGEEGELDSERLLWFPQSSQKNLLHDPYQT